MRVVHAVETLSRNAGGLPVAVSELAAALAHLDRDELRSEVLSVPGTEAIPIDEEVPVHQVSNPKNWLGEKEISIIHQHGIWARLPVAAGRYANQNRIPLLLSPHGMLEPWALAHHAWRKRIALALYQRKNLESAKVLHATSRPEAERFRDLGLAQPIAEIPLGIDPIPVEPLDLEAVGAPKEKKQVLFLSRIHPKKGVDLLLDAWEGVRAPEWELVIAGNDDGGYREALEAKTDRLDLRDRVRFAGPVFGREKDTVYRRADVFVLPSFSENFGIVVPEAMQYGLPVITTRGTPWEAVETEACGWQVEASVEEIGKVLETAISLGDDERHAMGERGRALVDRRHRWPEIAERFREVYRWMLGAGEPPDCVQPFQSA